MFHFYLLFIINKARTQEKNTSSRKIQYVKKNNSMQSNQTKINLITQNFV